MSEDLIDEVIASVSEITEKAKAKGTFNIVDVVKGRGYPTDNVNVYFDEQLAYQAAILREQINTLQLDADNVLDEERKAIEENLKKMKELFDETLEKLRESRYVFIISGISEGQRETIYKKSIEKFPVEYEESKNPFSGESTKTEIENPDRDKLFTNMLWEASIQKIISPDGSEQEGISLKDVYTLREGLPLTANSLINNAIDKVRAATATFLLSVDEDFLAKS